MVDIKENIKELHQEIDLDIRTVPPFITGMDKEYYDLFCNILYTLRKMMVNNILNEMEIEWKILNLETYLRKLHELPNKSLRVATNLYADFLLHNYIKLAEEYELYEIVVNLRKIIGTL